MQLKADLEENQNARRVLEQTVTDRLPRVEARFAEAKRLLFNRDREIAELTAGARRHKQALEEASSINAQKNAQIERLSTALTTRGSGRGRQSAGNGADAEVALRSEIESLRNKSAEQALLIDRLQRRLGSGFTAAEAGIQAQPESEADKARKDISEAEATIGSVRAAATPTDAGAVAHEREVRALRARTEDQAGEIARLKAALTSFEQEDGKAGGLKDSRIGLKARLNSAQAHADQQTATVAKLRAELAAAHERLARQAAHFMGEMRRIGGPTQPSGPARRPMREERRSLAERVAQIRTGGGPVERVEPRAPEAPRRLEPPAANGHGAEGNGATAAERKEPSDSPVSLPPAAEMPQASEIPDKRRRPRLLDRITGLAKS